MQNLTFILILVIAVLIILFKCLTIVPQAKAYVVEFLGSYKTTWGNGLHLKLPIVERVAKKVSLKEQVADFPPQPVITKDNVTMKIDTVVYYKVFDAKLYTYGVENPIIALENLASTTLRNIIGELELDETLTSRDVINSKMQGILDEATDAWGLKVGRVEVKNLMLSDEIQASMEKQMKAEREKRQTLLEADAHKQSAITRAQGDKEAKILAAQAEKEAEIERAQGRARSIQLVYEAEARGIRLLKEAGADESVLTLKKLDALKALGDGQATKIIVPSDLASAASNLTFTGEMLDLAKPAAVRPKQAEPAADDVCCDKPQVSTVTEEFLRNIYEE